MKEFDKWFAQITKEYPTYQDGEGYNIGNTRTLMVGWRAALRYIRKVGEKASGPEHNCYYEIMESIEKELKEEF
jgi:hypothetical protein